jgi:cyclic-di-GMP-binding protein
MPAFDIVCEVDMQEIDNVVHQAQKEISGRFDFRGGNSSLELDKNKRAIQIFADDELKLRSIRQIIETKMAKRSMDIRVLEFGDPKQGVGMTQTRKQSVSIREGLDKEEAKKITRKIKSLSLKVQAQIQDNKVRVTGKKIDDLQQVISSFKEDSLGLPLNYINMRN